MPTQTVNETLDKLIQEIKGRFPGVPMEFSPRHFSEHAELWVYMLDMERYENVRDFAKNFERDPPESELPIWIFVKTWSGPWPGGESDQTLQQRRRELERQIAERKNGN